MTNEQPLLRTLLPSLACPVCGGSLEKGRGALTCLECGKRYPIVDGIPILLSDTPPSKQYDHQREYFDRFNEQYHDYPLLKWHKSYLMLIGRVLRMNVKPTKRDLLLDIATGTGYVPIEFAKRGWRGVGLDLSPTSVARARTFAQEQGVADRTLFVVGEAEKLPFKQNVFTKITGIAILEHLADDRRAIREMARVGQANLDVFALVPNTYRYIWFFFWPLYLLHDRQVGHLRHYTDHDIKTKFSGAGFKSVDVLYQAHFAKILQKLHFYVTQNENMWWKLERIDQEQEKHPWALNVSVVASRRRQ